MQINADELLEHALRDGLREGIKSKFSASYNNPLDKLIDSAISARSEEFRTLLDESLKSCITDKSFREDIRVSVRT